MAFSAADLATLDSAIASGVVQVRFADGRQVNYGTVDALLRARAFVASQVAAPAAGGDPLQMAGGVTYVDFARS